MDYGRVMGAEKIAGRKGAGVSVAIVDSGAPQPFLNNVGRTTILSAVGDSGDDEFGHATEIGSILFGGEGITGICESAEPVYVKVLDSVGRGSVKSVADGIYWAIDADVDLINLSLGFMRTGKCPKMLEKACYDAFDAGKTIICAAGNDGGAVNWPAALRTTISVGSAGKNDQKTLFSSHGEVDFVAPGVNLSVLDRNGHPKTVSGTSFSAALVTGMAALLISSIRSKGESADMLKVMEMLRAIAADVGAPGWDDNTGYGLVAGQNHDVTMEMKIRSGFFGRMLTKVRTLLGL